MSMNIRKFEKLPIGSLLHLGHPYTNCIDLHSDGFSRVYGGIAMKMGIDGFYCIIFADGRLIKIHRVWCNTFTHISDI